MARKSRKNIMPQSAAPEIRISEEVNLLRTAAYARLSSENSGHETEDTLNTQILQIHNYIKEHPELTLTDTYVDNGFTGTNFDRPEFERMMQDVRTGKIQCIVVKDLSRFGRDYIETGNYLETIFPMLHIRFIAINDDFDNIRQSDVDSLAVPIKNMVNSLYAKDISKKIGLIYQMRREKGIPTSWCVPYGYRMNEQKSQYEVADEAKYVKLIYQWYLMGLSTNEIARRLEFLEVPRPNEHLNRRLHEGHDTTFNKWHSSSVLRILDLVNNMYSRDIAKKVRAALETNWKNGKATCTNVPFGYVWNKKDGQRWEIDPEAAASVKKVFELALSGRNTTQIAYGMNELNLPTPGLYAKRKNLRMGSNPIIAPDSEMLWNAAIVWRILRRYEYTGALVMGRRKKIDVNTTSIRTLPEDKWIIAENAHEAIVTKDEYYQAQKAIRNVTPIQYKVGDDFALKGKICCGNCKRQLRHEKQYGEMVFCCGYKRAAGKFSKCYGGYYREYSVNAKVARAIKTVFYALDVVNQGMQEKQSITVRCVDIEDLEKQAEAIRVEQIKLYESYADGVLRRDVYIEKKKALSEKLATLQDSIRIEKEEQECADELDEEIRALTKQASEKTYIGGLTKECVDAFVSMVYLYDDQTMKVEFNCEDVIRRALEKYGA